MSLVAAASDASGSPRARNATEVVVLVTPGSPMFETSVPLEVFSEHVPDDLKHAYSTRLINPGPPTRLGPGLPLDHTDVTPTPEQTVIVPPAGDRFAPVPSHTLTWLRRAHATGARIASLCSGAFVLAQAGLLDGRRCTTHWLHAEELRQVAPRSVVDERAIYLADDGIWSSAGSTASIDLCPELVRRDHGRAAASDIARRMVTAPHRTGDQQQFIRAPAPMPETTAPDLADRVRARLHTGVTVAQLAQESSVSVRTLHRHFESRYGTSPSAWLAAQRLAVAEELLETTELGIDQVAARAGFRGGDALRHHFRRAVGVSPTSYRRAFIGTTRSSQRRDS